jgi:heme exporter protein D
MTIELGATRPGSSAVFEERASGPAVQVGILIGALLSVESGLSLEVLAILLSSTALSLVLIVLRGERRRNEALRTAIDRLLREARLSAVCQG